MTLADLRKKREEERDVHEHGGALIHVEKHPQPLEYATIGLILAIVTAIEISLYYMEGPVLGYWTVVPLLIILSTLKFVLVVLWYMHLKFDNKLFSTLFVGGFVLALSLFIVALATVGGRLV
jgi:cytochrome c oxidase subunit IV